MTCYCFPLREGSSAAAHACLQRPGCTAGPQIQPNGWCTAQPSFLLSLRTVPGCFSKAPEFQKRQRPKHQLCRLWRKGSRLVVVVRWKRSLISGLKKLPNTNTRLYTLPDARYTRSACEYWHSIDYARRTNVVFRMIALLLGQCIKRKVLDHIAMFADQCTSVIFAGSHCEVSVVKNAFQLEVCRCDVVSKIAPEGQDTRKNAKGCLDHMTQKGVHAFPKYFLGAHRPISRKAA